MTLFRTHLLKVIVEKILILLSVYYELGDGSDFP